MSRLFTQTLREVPADADVAGHALLLRAGYIRQLGAGIFSALPLGVRALRNIETIIREEMNAIGGEEIVMPVVHPAEIWQRSGRWESVDEAMVRFQDRAGREMVLAMTHEEVVAALAASEISSYRQLPRLVYQLQTKFRDETRPRAGLIRTREFVMKDSYSLDADQEGLRAQYDAHYHAYFRIFARAGLPGCVAVSSDTGVMGGTVAHEYIYLSPAGEDTVVLCDGCGSAANQQVAGFAKPRPAAEEPLPLEEVETPGANTIATLAQFLDVDEARTAKAVFFAAGVAGDGGVETVLVMAMVRGDMDVNETKLSGALQARWLRPAEEALIRACGAAPGYASPVGLDAGAVRVVVDDLVAASPNLVSGANRNGWHLRNVNAARDFIEHQVTDIAQAYAGAPCAQCGAPLRLERGIEVGNIFQLGTRYSEAMGATFLDAEGREHPIVMGSYGIGVGRLLACVAEEHHDERGLCLPVAVAPYPVHLVRIGGDETVKNAADLLITQLEAQGIEVLDDDRDARPGVKFADADLMGMPVRITVSPRSLAAGGVELRHRESGAESTVAVDAAAAAVRDALAQH